MVAQSDLDPMMTPTSGPVGVLIGETSRKEKTEIIPIIHAHSKYIRTLRKGGRDKKGEDRMAFP